MADAPDRDGALVHARGLTRRFGNLIAVDAIDFEVEGGEAFGFLGPNGAGKTSGSCRRRTRSIRSCTSTRTCSPMRDTSASRAISPGIERRNSSIRQLKDRAIPRPSAATRH
jgi:ABC-type branched-subunit amino acid transport system ATPase component